MTRNVYDLGVEPPTTNGFLWFSHIKTLIFEDFFMGKGHTGTCSEYSHYGKCKIILVVHV